MNVSTDAVTGPPLQTTTETLPNLSAIIDDTTGKYTDDQKTQAFREREARDNAVIGPAVDKSIANGDGTLPWRAALSLLNSLSPAEQNSPRYRGTRQEILLTISTGDGPSPWKTGPPNLEEIQWGQDIQHNLAKQNNKSVFNLVNFLRVAMISQSATAVVGKTIDTDSLRDKALAGQSRNPATIDLPARTSRLPLVDRTV